MRISYFLLFSSVVSRFCPPSVIRKSHFSSIVSRTETLERSNDEKDKTNLFFSQNNVVSISNYSFSEDSNPLNISYISFNDKLQAFLFYENDKSQSIKKYLKSLVTLNGGKQSKKNVLILMSDTGGGHRASAQALDQALQEQYPGKFAVNIMDIWSDYANKPFNKFVPAYRFLAKHPLLWRAFYAYGEFPITKKFTEMWSWRNSYASFRNAINASRPDVVVSVHPLCQLMPISVVQELNNERMRKGLNSSRIPFITVVTDLGGAHNTWFDKRADAIFVPSDAVATIARKNRIPPSKLIQHGLPVRPSFWKPALGKEKLRRRLGLDSNRKTALLMGGGDGVGGLATIAQRVATRLGDLSTPTQLVVICGHNKVLTNSLGSYEWPKQVRVVVKGFVSNVDEYMAASDCLVTKAGPGTIAEAMIRGLPLVLSSYLPGQEAGNVPYVVNGGFGVFTGCRPKRIAETVLNLFADSTGSKLKKMSDNARAQSRPEATRAIAKDIATMTLSPSKFAIAK